MPSVCFLRAADVARDLARLSERKQARGAPAPAAPGKADAPRDSLASANALLARGKDAEAVAELERLVVSATGEDRQKLEGELRKVRALRDYNRALALYNKRSYPAALEAFEKIAAAGADPDLARAAAEKAKQVRALLKKN